MNLPKKERRRKLLPGSCFGQGGGGCDGGGRGGGGCDGGGLGDGGRDGDDHSRYIIHSLFFSQKMIVARKQVNRAMNIYETNIKCYKNLNAYLMPFLIYSSR